jgi:hypothetical protein
LFYRNLQKWESYLYELYARKANAGSLR